MPFVWGYKAHRISKSHLQKSRECGGLGLPCFLHYYWAANVRVMVYWQYGFERGDGFIPPPWLAIEKSLTSKTSLPALLFSSPRSSAVYRKDHFVLLNAQKIWNQIRKCCVLPDTSINAPIWQNHDFLPSLMDKAFREWSCKGIVSLKDLYVDGHLGSFEQLQSKCSLSKAHFFRYLQLRHYVQQATKSSELPPEKKSIVQMDTPALWKTWIVTYAPLWPMVWWLLRDVSWNCGSPS